MSSTDREHMLVGKPRGSRAREVNRMLSAGGDSLGQTLPLRYWRRYQYDVEKD